MRVGDIRWDSKGGELTLSATVTPVGGPSIPLWFRTEASLAAPPPVSGDPFLAALLLPAMRLGAPLILEAPVSPALLSRVSVLQDILGSWFGNARPIPVRAPPGPARSCSRPAVGCFFTGGADSFYSLLKNLHDHPHSPDSITHLVFVEGFDLRHQQVHLVAQTRDAIRRVADATGKTARFVSTNLREVTGPFAHWDDSHGSALAACAHFLAWEVGRILIPATLAYSQLHPLGSHALLDPLWSSEAVAIIHHGAEVRRIDKVTQWIARSPLALQHLRVCWENRNGLYNCGVCEKCLRTTVPLHALGVLDPSAAFRTLPTPALIRAMRIKNPSYLMAAETNLRFLESRTDAVSRRLAPALRRRILSCRLKLAFEIARGRHRVIYG